jgi:hypothetical protein
MFMSISRCAVLQALNRFKLKSGDAIKCCWRHGAPLWLRPLNLAYTKSAFAEVPSELSANNADSTLRIVKEQQPILSNRSRQPPAVARVNDRFSSLGWWRMTGSNRRPPACKAGALPAELIPRTFMNTRWWVWLDSNQRPPPYQDGALTD